MPIRTRRTTGSGGLLEREGAAAFEEIPAPARLCAALEAWFPAAARPLPWRLGRSGYRALVSEVMLQQTQASRVVVAFEEFLTLFPTPDALAAAPEGQVLAAWQGLGYYRRARLLHRAAQTVRDHHGGVVPTEASALRELPGVGRYTAGAIASIVHGAREPIVDGNVLRVLSRVAGAPTRAGDAASEAWAWKQATRLMSVCADPALVNEGLMELGATLCTPATPRCGECPLAAECRARAEGSAGQIPAPRRATPRRTLHWHALVDAREGGVLLVQRPDRGLWARLWQPPTLEHDAPLTMAALESHWGAPLRQVGAFTHITSHREVAFTVFVPSADAREIADTPARASADALADTPARASADALADTPARASADATPTIGGATRIPYAMLASYALANASWRAFEAANVPVRTPLSAAGTRRETRAAPIVATDS